MAEHGCDAQMLGMRRVVERTALYRASCGSAIRS